MKQVNDCLAAIDHLQNDLIGDLSNNVENNLETTSSLSKRETNSTREKLELFANLSLITPEHLKNGFVKKFLELHFSKPLLLGQFLNEFKKSLFELDHLNTAVASFAPEADLDPLNPYNGYRSMMKINQITLSDLLLLLTDKKKPNEKKLKSFLYRLRLVVLVNLIQMSWKAESDRLHSCDRLIKSDGPDGLARFQSEPNLFHQNTALFWIDLFQGEHF